MFDVDEAFRELNSYCALEGNIDSLVYHLGNAIDNLDRANFAVCNHLLIDDMRFDNEAVLKLKEKMEGYRNYLSGTCKQAATRNKQRMIDTIEGEGITIIWN